MCLAHGSTRLEPTSFQHYAGFYTDNWKGRLQAEYAKSEVTAKQGFQLAEWFIKKIKSLVIIRGNHDAWSGQGDPLEYIH